MNLGPTLINRFSKSLVSSREQLPRRTMFDPSRQQDAGAVQSLDRMHECRTVTLAPQILTHLDREVGPQTNEATVESRMMQGTQRQPVAHVRFAARLGVRDDVRRIQ